jgi:hypothetical protein
VDHFSHRVEIIEKIAIPHIAECDATPTTIPAQKMFEAGIMTFMGIASALGIGVISPAAAMRAMVELWTPAPRLMMWIGSVICKPSVH